MSKEVEGFLQLRKRAVRLTRLFGDGECSCESLEAENMDSEAPFAQLLVYLLFCLEENGKAGLS